MRVSRFRSLMFVVLGATILSCSKEEAVSPEIVANMSSQAQTNVVILV
jgi:hypothetical protein